MKIMNSPNTYQKFNTSTPKKNKNVSFTGASSIVQDFTNKVICNKHTVNAIKGYERFVLEKGPIAKIISKLADSPRGFSHLMVAESMFLTGFYMLNTAKNKKIKKEQKFPLMLNDFLVTALATVLNYTLDSTVDESIKKIGNRVKTTQRKNIVADIFKGLELPDILKGREDFISKEVAAESIKFALGTDKSAITTAKNGIIHDIAHKLKPYAEDPDLYVKTGTKDFNIIESFINSIDGEKIKKAANSIEYSDKIVKGIGLCKTMIIFTLIYRFLGPVVMTPLANKISTKVQNRNKNKKETESKQSNTTAPVAQEKIKLLAKA